jgi:hypothetical protein
LVNDLLVLKPDLLQLVCLPVKKGPMTPFYNAARFNQNRIGRDGGTVQTQSNRRGIDLGCVIFCLTHIPVKAHCTHKPF